MPSPDKRPLSIDFDGFERPESNYFKMPNQWTNVTAQIDNLSELKVVEYILRHTWGFQEFDVEKHITNDEFVNGRLRSDGTRLDRGTGLSLRGVRDGLNKAVNHGLIEEFINDSDKGRIRKSYRLKMKMMQSDITPNSEPVHAERQILPLQGQSLYPRRAKMIPRTEKETKEKHIVSNTFDGSRDRSENQRQEGRRLTAISEILAKRSSPGVLDAAVVSKKARKTATDPATGLIGRSVSQRPEKGASAAPVWLDALISDFSQELHDPQFRKSNVTHVMRLFEQSGLSEEAFRSQLFEAYRITKAHTIRKLASGKLGEYGFRNGMPYLLGVLRDRLGLGEGRRSRSRAAPGT